MAGAQGQNQNVFQQSAGNLGAASAAAQAAAGYQPMQVAPTGYNPATMGAAQLRNMNIGAYQNPFTRQVVDRTMRDLSRVNQQNMNQIGAAATAAGAFGGSRHGVAEAETNRAFMDTAADTAAGLRQAGFQNAQQAAMFDAGQRMAARSANMGAMNAAGQFNAGQGMQAQLANQSAGLAGAGQRLGAAGQLGQLANLGFGMGQQIQGQQAQQGAMAQAMMQALIDRSRGQFQGFTGAPNNSLQQVLGALGGVPYGQTQTTTKTPGLIDWFSLGIGSI